MKSVHFKQDNSLEDLAYVGPKSNEQSCKNHHKCSLSIGRRSLKHDTLRLHSTNRWLEMMQMFKRNELK